MAQQQPAAHIIAYDIADPRRLSRIHRYLKKLAMPVQYSVFLIKCSAIQLADVIADLESMIDPKKDDVRIYTLPKKPEILTLGQQGLAEGIYLVGDEHDWFSKW